MVAAARIKGSFAAWTRILAIQILLNSPFMMACAAKNGCRVPFAHRPHFSLMIRMLLMTLVAGIIGVAAFELDRDNIERLMIMLAACA